MTICEMFCLFFYSNVLFATYLRPETCTVNGVFYGWESGCPDMEDIPKYDLIF